MQNLETLKSMFDKFELMFKAYDKLVEDMASKKQLDTTIATFINLITEFKKDINSTILDNNNNVIKDCQNLCNDIKSNVEIITGDFVNNKEFNQFIELIGSQISQLRNLIPEKEVLTTIESRLDILETPEEEDEEVEGEDIVKEINLLPIDTDEYKIDKEHIKGLVDEIKELRSLITASRGGGTRGMPRRRITKTDLTSQCNGATKDFTLPVDTMEVIGVWGTQFPVIFSATDWTVSGRTLTLGDSLSAPETGQTLWALIETLN